jgi:hypothetical protein
MIKSMSISAATLVAAVLPALAQGGPAQGPQQPSVVGPTGTMYDGNNAQAQLPPGPNAWYEDRWAGYQPQTQSTWYFGAGDLWYAGRWVGYEPNLGSSSAGPASAVGAGATGSSLRGTTGAGEH